MAKKQIWTVLISTLLLNSIILSGCGSSPTSSASSQAPTESSSQEQASSGISNIDVCNGVGGAYQTYTSEFKDFRYGPSSVPWQVFYDLSDKASGALQDIAGQIDSYGIDWDAPGIVSSLIYSAAETIDTIKNNTVNNYFPPGSDLQTLLDEVDTNINSVLTSACTGSD